MFGSRRLLALLAIPALAASVAIAPVASAQDASPAGPSPGPECPLLTAEEVASALAITDVELSGASSFFCNFSGDPASLLVLIQPGGTLQQMRTENPGGVDVMVGEHPAWFVADSGSLWVESGGQMLGLSSSGGTLTGDALRAGLTRLAELALSRLPPGPSAEDIARLQALIPDSIGDQALTPQTFTGAMMMSFLDTESPAFQALTEALAAQGKTAADILVVAGNPVSESDAGILVVQIKGADASSLLLPFLNAFLPGASTAQVATKEIGGKQVTVVAAEPVISAYASGDVALYVNGPDDFLAEYFSSLP